MQQAEQTYQVRVGDRNISIKTDGSSVVTVSLGVPATGSITAYDASGRLVGTAALSGTSATLSLQGCATGVYVLQVVIGQEKSNWKVRIR